MSSPFDFKLPMPENLVAIDPGPVESGYVCIDAGEVWRAGQAPNEEILTDFAFACPTATVVMEWLNSMGMAVGQSVFNTCREIGRMQQHFTAHGASVHMIQRNEVKATLVGRTVGVTDAVIRQRLIDMFPATGGGKVPQVGVKADPGPLYLVKGHAWQALAAGLAWHIRTQQENTTGEGGL
jgi:hypothetical protein